MPEKAIFSWSGGKDSAMALYEARKDRRYQVEALLTTVTCGYDRVSMHGVRKLLLERQAESIGLPIEKVEIPKKCSDKEYESRMRRILAGYKDRGVETVIFGDIFLEDLRKYREDKLAGAGMKAVFPIWKRETKSLARRFIELGFEAILTCVDTDLIGGDFAGRRFDRTLLDEMPDNVDPCGENGEFHSFVFNGPIFRKRINFTVGEKVLRLKRFFYCDLLPA